MKYLLPILFLIAIGCSSEKELCIDGRLLPHGFQVVNATESHLEDEIIDLTFDGDEGRHYVVYYTGQFDIVHYEPIQVGENQIWLNGCFN